ncbi:hypothetical protein BDZ97DRAFT_1863141 [Flammula alnicola]|nr:hypothetical protein BDZ97DRAFT_1863141 [Flammula alnicola]
MIHAMVNLISSIPLSSPVREKYPDVFNINGALVILSDSHLGDPEIALEDWNEFWMRAHPFLVGLGEKLDEGQLGLDIGRVPGEACRREALRAILRKTVTQYGNG